MGQQKFYILPTWLNSYYLQPADLTKIDSTSIEDPIKSQLISALKTKEWS